MLPLRQSGCGSRWISWSGHRTVPIHTWWDPEQGHHLTTADLGFGERSCVGTELCRPGDRHASSVPGDRYVFVQLEGYLLCLGCPP